MAQVARELAAGAGWRVGEIVCSSGPDDPVEEERHDGACIAAVLGGTFRYRTSQGAALMAPGTLLLGNEGQEFACGHEHGTGDHCLSFHYSPAFLDAVAAAIPGAKTARFRTPALPPAAPLVPLFGEAAAAAETADCDAFEEIAWRLAGYAVSAGAESTPADFRSRIEEEHAVALAARKIESEALELESPALSLSALAGCAGMSPYRFLRLFARAVGMTPHRYVLHLRLARSAEWLITREDEISAIAFDAGFNDLSGFNRRFRRVMGVTPGAYRARRAANGA
ncbi:MAG TPA: helix-turn-helix transcriptional regulator [Rhizomicrobium sp.]|nr:helix-turn-helix transcriptional regulator [Rhizomicrobium sp.]